MSSGEAALHLLGLSNAPGPTSVSGGRRPRTKKASGSRPRTKKAAGSRPRTKRAGSSVSDSHGTYKIKKRSIEKLKEGVSRDVKPHLEEAFEIVKKLKPKGTMYIRIARVADSMNLTMEEVIARYMNKYKVNALEAAIRATKAGSYPSEKKALEKLKFDRHVYKRIPGSGGRSGSGGARKKKSPVQFEAHNPKKRNATRMAHYKREACFDGYDAKALGKAITEIRRRDGRNAPKNHAEYLKYVDAHRDWAKAVYNSNVTFEDGERIKVVPSRNDLKKTDAKMAAAWARHYRQRLHPAVSSMTRRDRIKYLQAIRHYLHWGPVTMDGHAESEFWKNKSKRRCDLKKTRVNTGGYSNHRVEQKKKSGPKRPAKGFIKFQAIFRKKNPGKNAAARAGAAWRTMGPAAKAKYD
jgi:hypothetical protein